MRLDATMRRPASSSILVTAPVRLRRVASGLMIEKVRVAVMRAKLRYVDGNWVGPAFSRACVSSQGATERPRSDEHTSELQSLMRISYAVFSLNKKKTHISLVSRRARLRNSHVIDPSTM